MASLLLDVLHTTRDAIFAQPLWLSSYIIMVLFHSLVCFVAYGWDKLQAIHHNSRVPEQMLHLLELLGGWPGALVAQTTFHHKNRKPDYQFTFRLIVALHITVLALLFSHGY